MRAPSQFQLALPRVLNTFLMLCSALVAGLFLLRASGEACRAAAPRTWDLALQQLAWSELFVFAMAVLAIAIYRTQSRTAQAVMLPVSVSSEHVCTQ
ncbi:hypothetical protein BV25DRAFT_1827465 [Artomyces pyxidatus]|uniref:Uncharacterized protein n=1 Tax=Artomyces pyxidatus TaxID=48021 RepID=A0ACB8SYC3_9AGAM|nr:hypothetical protein BV25DRAFT_1827465 [Artomyces pyxidatus]